jgi:hypothetical protein
VTARINYVIQCDHDGCDAAIEADLPTAWATRAAIRSSGWTYRPERRPQGGPARSVDLCEEHSK